MKEKNCVLCEIEFKQTKKKLMQKKPCDNEYFDITKKSMHSRGQRLHRTRLEAITSLL